MDIDYSKLSREQLIRLKKSLEEWLGTLKAIDLYGGNRPPFEISIVTDPANNTISVEKIENKRVPTSFGSKQRAHTVAYSAVLRSLVHLFRKKTPKDLKELLHQFHKELHLLYVTAIDCELKTIKGKKPIFGNLNLHQLKKFADQVVKEIIFQKTTHLDEIPVLLKLYLTSFVYMHNRFVDAVVDQDSKGRGEGAALAWLEGLGESSSMDNNIALKHLSRLIDEEAVKEALIITDRYSSTSLISFQILGIYRLVSASTELSKRLLINELFSTGPNDVKLIPNLTNIIFYKLDEENASAYHGNADEVQLVKESLAWLRDAYRMQDSYGTLEQRH
ncbi:MAG: hypothetical protein ACHQUC_06250 [Chlamydiales bacterium]